MSVRITTPYLIFHSPELPDNAAVDQAIEVLDEFERVQAGRYRRTEDRRRFVWRRYLRRYVLAQALDASPCELAFAALCPRCGSSAHGKPFLPDAPHLHFSAAQSGRQTAVAIGSAPLGIDIQAPTVELRDAPLFTPAEQAALGAGPAEADRRRAVLWTRKEAYLKAIGLGLSVDPATVDACASGFADGVFGQVAVLGQRSWSVASWTAHDAAIAVACAAPQPVRVVEIAATAGARTEGFEIKATIGGHEGATGMVYASSGVSGAADLSRGC